MLNLYVRFDGGADERLGSRVFGFFSIISAGSRTRARLIGLPIHDFNQRMWQPGGFHRPLAARHRKWKTATGKANFITPNGLSEDIDRPEEDRDVLQLITLRSKDQFNTTIYGYHDRFRGIHGTRMVVLEHRNDIDRLNLREGDKVSLITAARDQISRRLRGLSVVAYNIPQGCCGGYYPECNVLIPLWHHAERSKVPAAKAVPVRIEKDDGAWRNLPAETRLSAELMAGTPFSDMATDVTHAGDVRNASPLRQPLRAIPGKRCTMTPTPMNSAPRLMP